MVAEPQTIPADHQPTYGFIIDNRKCIGCHACSVACKSENEVPLSVNRTWVKYVETGLFPNSRRHFQVTRCNHCANPPCVRICPVEAMYQRADGIVEFDNSVCIGCKACLQACPYDAIYIDPENGTAAKCHYCAHRTDIGLEPACVVVCPEQAIIAGDMNDPNSQISHLLATQDVTVRKPEQGTAPKLFYIEGNDVVMHPTATERTPDSFMWADVIPLHAGKAGGNGHHAAPPATKARNLNMSAKLADTAIKSPQTQGQPWQGPIQLGSKMADHMVQVGYNAQHKVPWHWPVPAYLVTKGIAAGLFLLFGLGLLLDKVSWAGWLPAVTAIASVVFVGLTTGLLVLDLEKPERFIYILLRPQWRSWLARGAVVLISFSTVAGVWALLELLIALGVMGDGAMSTLRPIFLYAGAPVAIMVAVYTAFLFAQAEGRDLWQSPLLPIHLIVQALMAGAAALLIILLFVPDETMSSYAVTALVIGLIVDLFVTFLGEFGMPHASEVAARAAHDISHGHYRNHFWFGSFGIGHLLPLALLLLGTLLSGAMAPLAAVAGLLTIAGLYLYEYAFVMAPQEIQNS
ncbi:MAG: polysulfide reductase NrfD [Ardenticatenales bacterium]|nr:polysulfide reductase NrfD [Ardenticatenales bacterium]